MTLYHGSRLPTKGQGPLLHINVTTRRGLPVRIASVHYDFPSKPERDTLMSMRRNEETTQKPSRRLCYVPQDLCIAALTCILHVKGLKLRGITRSPLGVELRAGNGWRDALRASRLAECNRSQLGGDRELDRCMYA